MQFIGIDNGLSGAIAVIGEDGGLTLHDMPVINIDGKRKYNIQAIAVLLKTVCGKESTVVLEKAQPFPGQGVVSMFSTGYCFGVMQGILTALCVPYQVVPPQRWKKDFSLAGTEKTACVPAAQGLFPGSEFVTPRGRMIDGRADAALLAEFGRRMYAKAYNVAEAANERN